jgi:lipoprotein-anchoring transpeptidase ErfK/SrfK
MTSFRTILLAASAVVALTMSVGVKQTFAETKYNFSAKPWSLEKKFHKQEVGYSSKEAPGTIIISTRRRYLYFILGGGRAIRYGIGVGRSGFKWSGSEQITRKAEWPEWRPPAEMRQREPDLPVVMPGGEDNPLGARALYLGNTLYRIHGTAQPWTIGTSVSSGCIRLTNDNVIDLYQRTKVGAKVIVD